MKKSLIFAFAVVVVQVLQAATFSWGSSLSTSTPGYAPGSSSYEGYVAYLCVGTTLESTISDAQNTVNLLAQNKWTAPKIGVDETVVSKELNTIRGIIPTSASELSPEYEAGTTYYFYVVILDATGSYATVSSVVEGSLIQDPDPGVPARWDASGLVATSGGWQKIVPEPTALALLALGVAGVALRRRIR